MIIDTTRITENEINEIAQQLKGGKLVVLPTDTLYGISCSAFEQDAVEALYAARQRQGTKPCIILISSLEDLSLFSIRLPKHLEKFLQNVWPNPLTVILECPKEELYYLHRGKNSLAFRIPKHDLLQKILKQTGPILAPSANIEGEAPAETVQQAFDYFQNDVALYVDAGTLQSPPSTIIQMVDNTFRVERMGAFQINSLPHGNDQYRSE